MRATQALGCVRYRHMYVFMIVYDFELQFQLSSYHLLRDVPTSPPALLSIQNYVA